MRMNHGISDFSGLKHVHVVIDGYSYKAELIKILDTTIQVKLSDGSNVEVKKTNTFR